MENNFRTLIVNMDFYHIKQKTNLVVKLSHKIENRFYDLLMGYVETVHSAIVLQFKLAIVLALMGCNYCRLVYLT
jgi:hypothetical protein